MNHVKNEYLDAKSRHPLNHAHKDRLFRLVFGEKKDLLSLYNAINGTDYQDPEELTVTTLEDVIYLGMKNDVSFMIGSTMNLYEQQSSWSENMPLRGLIYFAGLYQEYVTQNGCNMYGSRRVLLPAPQYVVFYNGGGKRPEKTVLRLSDSFRPQEDGRQFCLECEATILNINRGCNKELLEKCRKLGEYAEFVAVIRDFLKQGYPIEDAVRQTITECLGKGILVDVLTRCRTEVTSVLLTEYNEAETWEYIRKEEREIAREEVREEVKAEVRREMAAEVRKEVTEKVRTEALEEGRLKEREQGIRKLVETCQELGIFREKMAGELCHQYSLAEDEAETYMKKYWK